MLEGGVEALKGPAETVPDEPDDLDMPRVHACIEPPYLRGQSSDAVYLASSI